MIVLIYLYLYFVLFIYACISLWFSLSLTIENETADKTLQDNDKQDMYLLLELQHAHHPSYPEC